MDIFTSRSIRWLAPLFVVGCTLAAFLNSLDGEFLMDDFCEILDKPLIEAPLPPWRVMLVGHELPSRPLPYLTSAIDHAIWRKRAFGYHLTNLAIHVVASLALFSWHGRRSHRPGSGMPSARMPMCSQRSSPRCGRRTPCTLRPSPLSTSDAIRGCRF